MKKALLLFFLSLNAKTPTAVIWIHGSMPFRFSTEKPYNHETFTYYPFHPFDEKGMVAVDETSSSIPSLFAKLYKSVCKECNLQSNNAFSFFTFGWSGKLSSRSRINAAKTLFLSIKKLQRQNSQIYIIAHSHGGNVAMNMSLFGHLKIDKLVLLGTPIQTQQLDLKMFHQIYNIYSLNDPFQIMDIFSTNGVSRTFSHDPNTQLVQIEVSVNTTAPRHQELWHLGKVPFGLYRQNFPLYPIPISALAPLLMSNDLSGNIDLRIYKSKNRCLLYYKNNLEKIFFEFDHFKALRDIIDTWHTA